MSATAHRWLELIALRRQVIVLRRQHPPQSQRTVSSIAIHRICKQQAFGAIPKWCPAEQRRPTNIRRLTFLAATRLRHELNCCAADRRSGRRRYCKPIPSGLPPNSNATAIPPANPEPSRHGTTGPQRTGRVMRLCLRRYNSRHLNEQDTQARAARLALSSGRSLCPEMPSARQEQDRYRSCGRKPSGMLGKKAARSGQIGRPAYGRMHTSHRHGNMSMIC